MLSWLFSKKELLTTFDREFYDRVCGKLSLMGIPYRTKWYSDASSGRSRGTLGSFGQEEHIQYYVYVKKEDYDYAASAVQN